MTPLGKSKQEAEEAWRVGGEVAEIMWRLNEVGHPSLATDSDEDRSVFGHLAKTLRAIMLQLRVRDHLHARIQDAVLNGYRFRTAVDMVEKGEW